MPGRNEKCPCGSGVKYKRCCLQRDREAIDQKIRAEQQTRVDAALAVTLARDTDLARQSAEMNEKRKLFSEQASLETIRVDEMMTPAEVFVDRFMTDFEKVDDAERLVLFCQALDDREIFDGDLVYEMVNVIHDREVVPGKRECSEESLLLLRERAPELFDEYSHYYLRLQILNAVAANRQESIQALTTELAEIAGSDVDVYSGVIDLLAYHGDLATLSQTCRIAWPGIRDSDNIMWGQGNYSRWGANCLLYEKLETQHVLDAHDSGLAEELEYYFEKVDVSWLADYLERISGQSNRVWSKEDFKLKLKRAKYRKDEVASSALELHTPPKITVDFRESLTQILDEFVDYARRKEGIPYTKLELGRQSIASYILKRLSGELEPVPNRDSLDEESAVPKKIRIPENLLVPDRSTLSSYLNLVVFDSLSCSGLLDYYAVATTFEMLPVWLRFLQTRGLVDLSEQITAVQEMGLLHADLLNSMETHISDSVLLNNFRGWGEMAIKELIDP